MADQNPDQTQHFGWVDKGTLIKWKRKWEGKGDDGKDKGKGDDTGNGKGKGNENDDDGDDWFSRFESRPDPECLSFSLYKVPLD